MSKNTVLIDSDAFIGWVYELDAHHSKSVEIFTKLRAEAKRLVTTDYVISEVATVLSNRVNQESAVRFLELVSSISTIHINEDLFQKALDLFKLQKKKGTSVVDCLNVVVMREFDFGHIFSFDKVYGRLKLAVLK